MASPTTQRPGARPRGADGALRWWREVLLVLAFYWAYSYVRSRFGSAAVSADTAWANARGIMRLEDALGIGNELAVQRWFLQWPTVVWSFNVFYGLFHFVVPIGTLAALFRFRRDLYRRWRTVLGATTALALVGFALFPLMPPRLLCACAFGSGVDAGFVDTLDRFGGLWRFGTHTVSAISNQYAAMPSLHFAWALWAALALRHLPLRAPGRALAAAYPAVTLVAIVVTGNHFWLDAIGAAAAVGIAVGFERAWSRATRRAHARQAARALPPGAGDDGGEDAGEDPVQVLRGRRGRRYGEEVPGSVPAVRTAAGPAGLVRAATGPPIPPRERHDATR